MKDIRTWILLCAVTLPLSMVCVTSADLPPGETVSQWVWFDRTALAASACILLAIAWGRKDRLPVPADVAEVATLKKDNVSLQHNILALITKWIKNKKLKRQTYTNVCLFYLKLFYY